MQTRNLYYTASINKCKSHLMRYRRNESYDKNSQWLTTTLTTGEIPELERVYSLVREAIHNQCPLGKAL